MSKKSIDSEIFSDPWFMDLSKDGKVAYFYLLTNCDCAGILKLNERLFCFQTGIKGWSRVAQELGNRLRSIKGDHFWIPKYIDFQYPKGLSESSNFTLSVIKRLREFCLWDEERSTVRQELTEGMPTVQEPERAPVETPEKAKKSRASSEEEVCDYVESIGLPRSDGLAMWNHWEGNGHMNAGKAMKDWKAVIRSWRLQGYLASQKFQSGKDGANRKAKPAGKPNLWSLKEQLEACEKELDGLRYPGGCGYPVSLEGEKLDRANQLAKRIKELKREITDFQQ